jgi:hypothetical protein
MTLEQRMQAAREASLETRQRPVAALPEPDPEPFVDAAPDLPALEHIQVEPPHTAPARQAAIAASPKPTAQAEIAPPIEQARQLAEPTEEPPAAPRETRQQRQVAAPRTAPAADGGSNAIELAAEIMVIQRALEAEPNRADLHRKLGFLLARQGKTAEAATEFRKALQASRTSL